MIQISGLFPLYRAQFAEFEDYWDDHNAFMQEVKLFLLI